MKVIAIIVTYNGMKWYKDCFDSLRNSTIPIQPIVIDNASSDNTVTYIKENYPEIHLVESKENLGFGKANNIGFKYAIEQNADYVFLLNQDAWIKPATIVGLIQIMQQNPQYGILSPLQINASETRLDYKFTDYLNPTSCPELTSDLLIANKKDVYPIDFTNAAMWLISKNCFEKVGGFEPLFFHYGEDVNYVYRSKFHSFSIGICPTYVAIHDREYTKTQKISFRKKQKQNYIYYLTQITNINEALAPMLYRLLATLLSQFIYNTLTLKISASAINICTAFSLVVNLYSINRARKKEKETGAYLL